MRLPFLFLVLFGASGHEGQIKFGEAPVPGALVQATQGTNTVRAVTDDGHYTMPDLADGAWTLQVEMSGFEVIKREVLVSSGAPPQQRDLKMLSLQNLQASPAATAFPKTVSPVLQETTPSDEAASRLLINGTVSNAASSPFGLARAIGNNRFGQRSPYNGNISLNFNNAVFDARSFSLTGQDTRKPAYSRMTGGLTFGGPFRIPWHARNGNFTMSYGRTQNRTATLQTARMPTDEERRGDFSSSPKPVIDPLTGSAFVGNHIPSTRIASQASELMKLYRSPNDLTLGIVRAQQAAASYYILGYYPTNAANDGKIRRVKITLKNRTASLSYRESYYADKDFSKYTAADKERQLEEALMLGDPITDLTIAMELNYFQLNSAEYFVPLAVKIPGGELVLAQKEGAKRTIIDFIGEIKNEYGATISNIRDKVEIKLEGETASRLASSPVQYDAGFTLLPAKYTIRFLARNSDTGRIGTYQADFVVPNLNRELVRLPISSVVLSNQRVAMADALFNAGKTRDAKEQVSNPLIEDGLKLMPSITRVFSRSRDMYVYLQAYERDAAMQHPLAVVVAFFKSDEKVFQSPAYTMTEGMDAKSKAVPFKLTLSLGAMADGNYRCQITVLDPSTQKASFWQAPIKIVP